jgi:hypothetical protein
VLDRVHFDAAFSEGGGPLDSLDMRDVRINHRLIGEIFAAELPAMADGRGMESEHHVAARVESGAGQAGTFAKGGLLLAEHGKAALYGEAS